MTTRNNTSLGSLLCDERWIWDSRDENQISFDDNGTGKVRIVCIPDHYVDNRAQRTHPKLICRGELNVWIAAEFEWKALSGTTLDCLIILGDQKHGIAGKDSDIAELEIEITLTKRRIPTLGYADMTQYTINESLLTEAAFHPKAYTLRLESGVFRTAFDEMQIAVRGEELPYTPKYGLRLLFDKSPYPEREQWKAPGGAPDAMKFWEWKEFCGRKL